MAKCPNCGGDLKRTKIKIIGGHKEFVCLNCNQPVGIVKDEIKRE
jgi:DNA-directed RNA polymerase subunit RPC12/RpoP